MTQDPSRRDLIMAAALATGGLGFSATALAQQGLPPTPECKDSDEPTAPQTEGPFYKPSSPERADLREPGLGGLPVVLTGLVLTRRCRPVARALVDLWHADDKGDYDNRGFRYRGHQHADAQGRYHLETIVPAEYPGRTRHIHVKVQAPGGRILTTQLYFPGDPRNKRDGLYRQELEVKKLKGDEAGFDFVV